MPRYAVRMIRTLTEYATEYPDAPNEGEARKLALAEASNGDCIWNTDYEYISDAVVEYVDTLQ